MKNYTLEQKEALRDKIIELQEGSGLSGNAFAVKRLGFSNGSKFSHVRNNWDKPGMVGEDTWEIIDKYINKTEDHKAVVTANLKKVFDACERAYRMKKHIPIIGEGGYGKSFGLEKYKQYVEREQKFKVVYFDASRMKTNKDFVIGLMNALECYKPGTMPNQLAVMRDKIMKQDILLQIDEVSALKGSAITIIKDVMTYFKDLCGIVFTGTPYFYNNLKKGALRDRHLFSETKDRLFMLPVFLDKPTVAEAKSVFIANGISSKEELDIVLGRDDRFTQSSWLVKQTFRGIKDCIDMIKMADMPELDYEKMLG